MKLLLLLLCVAYASASGYCPNGDKYDLLDCAMHLFDANNDSSISQAEYDSGFSTLRTTYNHTYHMKKLLLAVNETFVFEECDLNEDGVLDAADWNNATRVWPTSLCLTRRLDCYMTCKFCSMTDWTPPPKPQSMIDAEEAQQNATLTEMGMVLNQ